MTNLSLFDDMVVDAPSTQGIKYAGSKLKLLPHILDLAKRTHAKTVLDGFAGSTRVSQAFAKTGYRVICNDTSVWSEVFGTSYLHGPIFHPKGNHNRIPSVYIAAKHDSR